MVSSVAIANSRFQHYVQETPTISTGIYASGDNVGGKISLVAAVEGDATQAGPVGGLIQSVILTDLGKQSDTMSITFFDTDPTNSTLTDNAAIDIDDLDLVNIIGTVSIASTDYTPYANNSVGQALQLAIPFVLPTGNTLYAVMAVAGTPTYVSTSDLTLRVGILKG